MTKKISNSVRAGLLGIALASAGATSSFALVGDVVVNGDFEAGNTGFTSTYGYTVPGGNVGGISGNLLPEEAYTVDTNPNNSHSLWGSFADHTPGLGTKMLIVNGGNSVTDFVWKQTVNVTPGLTYFFEAWIANVYPDSPANLNFVIVDGANTINLGPAAPLGSPVGLWNLISPLVGYVPINSSLTLRLDNANTVRNGNDFAVDDISFATERQIPVVPEVSTGISAGAFALIGGLIVLRRRKAAQAA